MQAFFDKAVKIDQAGHVLYFNTKPVALIAIVLESRGKTIKEEMRALKGWKVLKKHQDLFSHPNFIFTENLFEPDKDLSVLHIYFINKLSLRACLKKYNSAFQEILGSGFSSEKFISQLEEGLSLPHLVNQDELLTGLLLGFGEESSKAFKNKYVSSSDAGLHVEPEIIQGVSIKMPQSCDFMPVMFVGNPNSPEVKQLVSTYEQELQATWSMYKKSKKPLKTILERLCDDTGN